MDFSDYCKLVILFFIECHFRYIDNLDHKTAIFYSNNIEENIFQLKNIYR